MKLTFYRDIYKEPFRDNLSRVLFEGIYNPPDSENGLDFYIYVWIENLLELVSFQAVLADSVVMLFRMPDYLTTGSIKREPINRAVSGRQSDEEETNLRSALKEMEHDCFQPLLDKIKRLAEDGFDTDRTLNESETAVLKEYNKQ